MCCLEQDDLQPRSLKPPPTPAMIDSELSSAVPGGIASQTRPRAGAAAYRWEEGLGSISGIKCVSLSMAF
jgi:hypothetical protein